MSQILRPSHDEWETPPALIDCLELEFSFDLDAAATEENRIRPIPWLTDALHRPWDGQVVWCNPPYSQIREFVGRAREQSQHQRNTVVLLIPAYTDPKYWWDDVLQADEIRFLKGRLAFLEHGKKRTTARFPSVLVIFRWRTGIAKKYPAIFWWDWRA